MAASSTAAVAWLRTHVDLARESGDALREAQDLFGLGVVEVARLLTLAVRGGKPAMGSIAQRLRDSDSAGSFPYARHEQFVPDRTAPRLKTPGSVRIGRPRLPRLGLGCMRLVAKGGVVSGKTVSALGIPHSPEASRHALLNAVEHSGVRYLDIARGYGPWPGAGEGLMRDWFAPYREDLVIASKVGYRRTPKGGWFVDLDPDFLRAELRESHRQLGAPVPLMYLVVKSTPTTPVVNRPRKLERALAPLLEAQREGLITDLGVANGSPADLARLCDFGPIAVAQNRLSLGGLRKSEGRDVLDWCGERKLPFVAWGVFSEGAQPEPSPSLSAAALELQVTVGELTLALLLAFAPHLMALPGPQRRATVESCIAGASLRVPRALTNRLLSELL